jgi:hypothetical protein
MNCQEVIEFMQRQLDEDLDAQEEAQLADHLKHCSECQEMYQRLKQLSSDLTNLPKVVPAYSLVDAILPKLVEIDMQNPANSPSNPNTNYIPTAQQPLSIPRTRRFGSSFSWKVAGGVIAAGLVLGIFLFQTNNSRLDQAQALFAPRNNGQTAPTAAGSQTADSSKKSENIDKFNSPTPKESRPAASAQNQSDNSPLSGSNSAAPRATEKSVQPSQKPMSQDNTAVKPDQKGNAGAPGTDKSSAAPTASSAPSAAPTATASAATKGQESSASQASEPPPIAASPKAATVQPSPAAAGASPAPDQGVANKAGNSTMSIAALMPEETLRSKDGKYLAAIEQHKVTIKNQDSQDIIFSSERVWSEKDKVTFLTWSEDGKLTYQVVNDTSTQNFEINVVLKSEALLK